jgi:hypothetical protein
MPNTTAKGFVRTWIDYSCEVATSADTLYRLLADIDGWASWTPGLISIRRRTQGEYVPGTKFTMTLAVPVLGKVGLPSQLYVNEPTVLEWGGGALGSRIRHRMELTALGPQTTRLRHLEYATGFLALVSLGLEKGIYRHDRGWSDAIQKRFAPQA